MTKKQRLDYLLVTLAAFAGGFLMAFLMARMAISGAEEISVRFGSMTGADANFPVIPFSLVFGGIYCALASGIMLATRFFARRSRLFKIAAAFLAPLTVWCISFWSIISFVPYFIANIVKLCRRAEPTE